MNENAEIISEFLVESHESLDQLDRDFIALEDSPRDHERLANIFRTVHTIKGTSSFLAFSKLERIAHVGENLLVPLRDGKFELDQEIASTLLCMVDAIREILTCIETDGTEGSRDYSLLTQNLEQFWSTEMETLGKEQTQRSQTLEVNQVQQPTDRAGLQNVKIGQGSTEHQSLQPSTDSKIGSQNDRSILDSTLRIDVRLLDRIMNLVGELVLARNQVLQNCEHLNDFALQTSSQHLSSITSELQESVLKTRMQPIRNAWHRLPRIVRDLSANCNREIKMRMKGGETELDKTILEAIRDPLTHIVRNAVDHGIEAPEDRESAGKPREGLLSLFANQLDGQINIEICDDGRGINVEKVRARAIENGIITCVQAQEMSDLEVINLISLPGFSTAEQVTHVSGRGVGMDVVKTNIEKISGSLEIHSEAGHYVSDQDPPDVGHCSCLDRDLCWRSVRNPTSQPC